jgi:hypothetical protein
VGLFSKRPPTERAPRRIPTLDPVYYDGIHAAILGYGGSDSREDVAYGVADAVENTADRVFAAKGDRRSAGRFDAEFGGHAHDDFSAADRMIDWLRTWDASTEETMETLLRRLQEVLSKPPASDA